jgi:hypothetical protein
VSHKSTTVVIKKLGEKHDQKVLDWVAGQVLDPGFTLHSQLVPPCYILQGDNYDTTVHARDMRMDNQNKSLHYFNTYAVKDRPDFYKLDSGHTATSKDIKCAPTSTFLPTMEDCKNIRDDYVIVAKVLVDHLTFLHPLKKCVPSHVVHKYSSEMSKKSEIVSNLICRSQIAKGWLLGDTLSTIVCTSTAHWCSTLVILCCYSILLLSY